MNTVEAVDGDDRSVRERLLDAAESCFAERGISRTRMGDLATLAGVHRTTVYLHFPNKDALLAASFERAINVVFDATEDCWLTEKAFVDQVVDASVAGLSATRDSPTLRLLTTGEQLSATSLATAASETWSIRLAETLGRRLHVAADRGDVRQDINTEMMARWITRICFSLVAQPGTDEDGGDEGVLRAFLRPALSPRAAELDYDTQSHPAQR
jgi:AcrR family transcriptional regulator